MSCLFVAFRFFRENFFFPFSFLQRMSKPVDYDPNHDVNLLIEVCFIRSLFETKMFFFVLAFVVPEEDRCCSGRRIKTDDVHRRVQGRSVGAAVRVAGKEKYCLFYAQLKNAGGHS
jgi:hypothetical protein